MKKNYDFSKGKRGAVVPSPGKTRITIRIDDDILDWFRERAHEAGGASYQAMMNRALRDFAENQIEPLEETLRRVLLEVLPSSTGAPGTGKATRKAGAKKTRRKAGR